MNNNHEYEENRFNEKLHIFRHVPTGRFVHGFTMKNNIRISKMAVSKYMNDNTIMYYII